MNKEDNANGIIKFTTVECNSWEIISAFEVRRIGLSTLQQCENASAPGITYFSTFFPPNATLTSLIVISPRGFLQFLSEQTESPDEEKKK